MKKTLLFSFVLSLTFYTGQAQFVRKDMKVPDIPDYITLKCDFHIHTVFSDGNVWPTIRVDEAWALGYDAISITDHIEYQPHKDYIPVQHNAGYEIAKPKGDRQDIIIIKGTEITRQMPPGHLNGIFIKDAAEIETQLIKHKHSSTTSSNYMDSIDHVLKDYMHALKEAHDQGGFIFWNHPGWASQAPEGIKIYDVHKELIEKGWINGIEVANSGEWYPEAFQWCLDNNLAMLSNSDIHPTEEIFETNPNIDHRPVTLVFTKSKSAAGIREALDAARTVVWFNNMIIGHKEFVEPLFYNSIEISNAFFTDEKGRSFFNLKNNSDFVFRMKDLDSNENLILLPQSTLIIQFDEVRDSRRMVVDNFLIEPDKSLEITLKAKN
jgi:histidinol phosphatase-like PHP family hydrolase